jgi:hypothetical protein
MTMTPPEGSLRILSRIRIHHVPAGVASDNLLLDVHRLYIIAREERQGMAWA